MDVGHHQDWKPVVIRKKTDKAGDDKEGGGKKGKKPGHSLDDNKDEFKNKKISKEISLSIVQHRCAMKLNQKQLAGHVHIKPEVLQKYENGQAIVDPRVLNKIKRILKMK